MLDGFEASGFSGGWESEIKLNTFRFPPAKRRPLFGMLLATRIRFVDGKGGFHATSYSGSGSGGHIHDPLQRMSVSVTSKAFGKNNPPAGVLANIVTDIWERAYTFELKDVPLPAKK